MPSKTRPARRDGGQPFSDDAENQKLIFTSFSSSEIRLFNNYPFLILAVLVLSLNCYTAVYSKQKNHKIWQRM